MAHHEIKIQKEFMQAKVAGDKPFEIRLNDRGYQKGDTITYISDKFPNVAYDGEWEITYVTAFAQRATWVVFGDKKIDAH
jgi:ASC-1-like (ASCH) protein